MALDLSALRGYGETSDREESTSTKTEKSLHLLRQAGAIGFLPNLEGDRNQLELVASKE